MKETNDATEESMPASYHGEIEVEFEREMINGDFLFEKILLNLGLDTLKSALIEMESDFVILVMPDKSKYEFLKPELSSSLDDTTIKTTTASGKLHSDENGSTVDDQKITGSFNEITANFESTTPEFTSTDTPKIFSTSGSGSIETRAELKSTLTMVPVGLSGSGSETGSTTFPVDNLLIETTATPTITHMPLELFPETDETDTIFIPVDIKKSEVTTMVTGQTESLDENHSQSITESSSTSEVTFESSADQTGKSNYGSKPEVTTGSFETTVANKQKSYSTSTKQGITTDIQMTTAFGVNENYNTTIIGSQSENSTSLEQIRVIEQMTESEMSTLKWNTITEGSYETTKQPNYSSEASSILAEGSSEILKNPATTGIPGFKTKSEESSDIAISGDKEVDFQESSFQLTTTEFIPVDLISTIEPTTTNENNIMKIEMRFTEKIKNQTGIPEEDSVNEIKTNTSETLKTSDHLLQTTFGSEMVETSGQTGTLPEFSTKPTIIESLDENDTKLSSKKQKFVKNEEYESSGDFSLSDDEDLQFSSTTASFVSSSVSLAPTVCNCEKELEDMIMNPENSLMQKLYVNIKKKLMQEILEKFDSRLNACEAEVLKLFFHSF